jgi:hypothetical protein
MKRFVLASLIALAASQAAGCIITSGDDTGDDAFISATWQLRSEATNTTAPCPPGFDTAALYNQPVDANGNNNGAVIIDLFDCAAGSGTSAPLPPTLYKTWVVIANHDNSSQYATSLSAFVDVTTADKTFNTQILVDGGYFQLQWALRGATTNADLSCSQAGAAGGVEAIGTDVSTPSNSNSDIFDCEDRYGVTAGYLQGTYTISVAALNSANQSIGTAPTITNKTIQGPNKVTDLGLVTIPITGL